MAGEEIRSACVEGEHGLSGSSLPARLLLAEEVDVVLWSALFVLSLLIPQQICLGLVIGTATFHVRE